MSTQTVKLSPQEEEHESNGTAVPVVTAFQGKDQLSRSQVLAFNNFGFCHKQWQYNYDGMFLNPCEETCYDIRITTRPDRDILTSVLRFGI